MNIDLSDLNAAYESACGGKFADGIYHATVIKAEVSRSKADRRQVVWELEVRDVTTGRTIVVKKYSQLAPDSMFWLHSELKTVGITLAHINDLHQALKGFAGSAIEIDLENTGDWYVVKFIRLIRRAV